MPSRALPFLLLPVVSEAPVSDPGLLLCIIVGGDMEEAEDSADEEVERAGRNAGLYAWELLLPLWSPQMSALLSTPALTAAAAPSPGWTMLSTAG